MIPGQHSCMATVGGSWLSGLLSESQFVTGPLHLAYFLALTTFESSAPVLYITTLLLLV